MNRAELVDAVANATGQTKQQINDTLSAILHYVTGCLSKGEKVLLVGFGSFERRARKARVGVNPQDPRQKLTIAAAKVPIFRAGQDLKAIVDGRQKMPSMPKTVAPSKANKVKKGGKAKKASKKRR